MPDDPTPFTDEQRHLFSTVVASLNKDRAADFTEADHWLDVEIRPPTAAEEYRRFLRERVAEAKSRWGKKDRAYRIERSCPEPGRGIVTYREQWWQQASEQERKTMLRRCRNYFGQTLRHARSEHLQRVRDEATHGPLRRHQLLDLAASRLLSGSRPLVFDAMEPEEKLLWARRVLRVVWILTDTAPLNGTGLEWLRTWKWGKNQCDFEEDGSAPRLFERIKEFDRYVTEWERLTKLALMSVEEVTPGATSKEVMQPAVMVKAEANGTRPRKTRKKIREEKNVAARDFLRQHYASRGVRPKITVLAQAIGCSPALVSGLPVWKALMAREAEQKGPRQPKVISLTSQMERVTAEAAQDETLKKLLEDQDADYEPSPLGEITKESRGGSPRRGKVYRR